MNRSTSAVAIAIVAVAMSVLMPALVAQGCGNPNPGVIPIHARPGGHSYGWWNARWWQWATSFPADPALNPVMDPTGAAGHLGQSGPVWFLAGTYGDQVTRNVTIPRGKKILVPVMNQEWDNVYGFDPLGYAAGSMSYPQLLQVCDYIIDQATNMSVTVDGTAIQNLESYRAPSPPFVCELEPTLAALWGYPTGPIYPCAADGIYLILRPLTPGQHVIHIHSENLFYPWFVLDVTYNITIP